MKKEKILAIGNQNFSACYNFRLEAVTISNNENGADKLFAGYPLLELFRSFMQSMNENITFDDTVKFFEPTIGNVLIEK